MTIDEGRKPERGAGALSQSWRRRSLGVEGNWPKRFSVQRKMAIVARLLRGEPLDPWAGTMFVANIPLAHLD